MNNIEKLIRSYSLYPHRGKVYSVDIMADNNVIESHKFVNPFAAYIYMNKTEVQDNLRKRYCKSLFRLQCLSSVDDSCLFSVFLNMACGLQKVEFCEQYGRNDLFLYTGDILKYNGSYYVYVAFADDKFHFISTDEFDVSFDSLSDMEKIYLKIYEDEFIQAVSHCLHKDPWYYNRWKLDYQVYKKMGNEMRTIILQTYKNLQNEKEWFYPKYEN